MISPCGGTVGHTLRRCPMESPPPKGLGRGDLAAAEEFGRAALRDGPSLAARLMLAQALAWQGRGRDADAVLAEVDESALSEAELMAWALPRAANQFWMLDQPERATAFLRTVRGRVTSEGAGATLDALLGTFAMNAGSPNGRSTRARCCGHRTPTSRPSGGPRPPPRCATPGWAVRRRRRAGGAGDRRRASRAAALHQRLRTDDGADDVRESSTARRRWRRSSSTASGPRSRATPSVNCWWPTC